MSAMLREEIFRLLRANPEGLEESAVLQLRARFGYNELPERRRSLLRLFFRQFQSVVVAILLVAAALSAAMPLLHASSDATEWFDAAAILAIVFLNAIFGFAQEWKAENAIAQLKRLSAPVAKVRRNGTLREVPSRDVVPGDVLVVDAGDRLSADARLVASASLEVDESSLTGESLAAAKRSMIELEASTGTSAGMLYAGTLVTRGSGEAVITGTGLSTQIGTITKLMLTLEQPPTPLSVALQHAGRNIGLAVLALCLMLFGIGLW